MRTPPFPAWRALTGKARGDLLRKIADDVDRRRDEIARTITLENGKPLAQSLGEVAMTVDHLRWFAEEARRAYGRIVPTRRTASGTSWSRRRSASWRAISPWNFPLVPGGAQDRPGAGGRLPGRAEAGQRHPAVRPAVCRMRRGGRGAGRRFPGGRRPRRGDRRTNSSRIPLCRKITFTGSTEVGQALIRGAAKDIKPLSLELGGHAPVLVFADADLDRAVEGAMVAKFRNTGQSCIAANRIYVQRPVYGEFLERFARQARELKVGDGLEAGVRWGRSSTRKAWPRPWSTSTTPKSRGARLFAADGAWSGKGWFS